MTKSDKKKEPSIEDIEAPQNKQDQEKKEETGE